LEFFTTKKVDDEAEQKHELEQGEAKRLIIFMITLCECWSGVYIRIHVVPPPSGSESIIPFISLFTSNIFEYLMLFHKSIFVFEEEKQHGKLMGDANRLREI
jgi:hypothetical protein